LGDLVVWKANLLEDLRASEDPANAVVVMKDGQVVKGN